MKYKRFFSDHILDTPPESYIPVKNILICYIREEIHTTLHNISPVSVPRIYLPTKVLKHAYDKRREFTELHIHGIHEVLTSPDVICLNNDKKSDFIFFKKIGGRDKFYSCPVEISVEGFLATTSFFSCKEKYIKKFPTLWDREDGVNPPS